MEQNGIRFNEGMTLAEDTLFVFWLRFFNAKIVDTEHTAYVYRFNPNSATSNSNKVKHFSNMLAMTQEYISVYEKYQNRPDLNTEHVQKRMQFATQHLLFDSLFCKTKAEQNELINWLKSKELYPYPIFWETISTKYGKKNLIYNLFCLFLPVRPYYRLMSWLIRWRHK